MRVAYFLLFFLLISCNNTTENTPTEDAPPVVNTSYFERIFLDTETLFRGYQLEDTFDLEKEEIIALDNEDKAQIYWQANDGILESIRIRVTVIDPTQMEQLKEAILYHFNSFFNANKPNSNFVSWSFTTPNNQPAEVVFIQESDRNLISVLINTRSHR